MNFQPWLLCTSIHSRKAMGFRAHSIGITHRGRTGHWNSIDHAICRLLLINPCHYEYRRLIELLMLLGSNKLNIDEQSHIDLVWPVIYLLGCKQNNTSCMLGFTGWYEK